MAFFKFAVAVDRRSGLIKIFRYIRTNWSVLRRPPRQKLLKGDAMSADKEDKILKPIDLDTDQLEELDRLIDNLKKEIVFPAKKISQGDQFADAKLRN